jgi:hypothetical protein
LEREEGTDSALNSFREKARGPRQAARIEVIQLTDVWIRTWQKSASEVNRRTLWKSTRPQGRADIELQPLSAINQV